MANQNNISFRIKAEDDFTQVMRNLESKLTGVANTISGLASTFNSAMSAMESSTTGVTSQVNTLNSSISGLQNTTGSIDTVASSMEEVAEATDDATDSVDALATSETDAAENADELGASASSASTNVDDLATSTETAGGNTNTLTNRLEKASGAITATGQTMSIVGGVIAGALGLAANKALDFEQQMSNIKAVSGATGEDMEKLTQLAIDLGSATKYSALEAGQGIEELIKAGVSLDDIMSGGLAGALSLATAGELELADAAEIASTALNSFRDDNLSVMDAADLLAGAANASATSVGELKYGLSMVSAVASGVGMSFKDTSTALAVFAQNGLKGSDGGTSLKTMLLNLSPATDGAAAQMDKLGLLTEEGTSKFYDAEGSLKSLAEISDLLKSSMANLSDEQRQMAMKVMFGTDAIRAANILYKEGAKGVNYMYGEMSKVTAAEVAAEKMNNVRGQMEELSGAIETMAISIGSALLPFISMLVSAFQWLVDKFNELSPAMQTSVAIIGLVTAGISLLVGPLLILIALIPAITSGFTAIAGVFGVTSGVLLSTIGVIFGVIAAVAAIGVALVAAYTHIDWFRNMVDEAWAWIKKSWDTSLVFISGIVKSVMKDVSTFIGEQLAKIKSFWQQNGENIRKIATVVFLAIYVAIRGSMALIQAVIIVAWNIIKEVTIAVWNMLKGIISGVVDVILGIIKVFSSLLTGDWEGAWDGVKQITKGAIKVLGSIVKGMYDIGKNIITGLINGITGAAGKLMDTAKSIASKVTKTIKSAFDINSPSRVMNKEVGRWIPAGIADGITGNIKSVVAAAKEMSASIMPDTMNMAVAYSSPSGLDVSEAKFYGRINEASDHIAEQAEPQQVIVQVEGDAEWIRAHVNRRNATEKRMRDGFRSK